MDGKRAALRELYTHICFQGELAKRRRELFVERNVTGKGTLLMHTERRLGRLDESVAKWRRWHDAVKEVLNG